MSAAAALIAYLPARALGLQQSFWGAITAIAVVQTEFGATRTSARDQFTGAAIGGLIGVAIVSLIGQEVIRLHSRRDRLHYSVLDAERDERCTSGRCYNDRHYARASRR